jgi:hypothetical protein
MPLEIYKKTLSLVLHEWASKVDSDALDWAKEEYDKL